VLPITLSARNIRCKNISNLAIEIFGKISNFEKNFDFGKKI